MKNAGWILLLPIGLLACNKSRPDTLPPDGAPPVYIARIQRTNFGILHVTATDEKGLGYGLGYAFAQDNACVLGVDDDGSRPR